MYTIYMADTSLNEDRLGILVWQTSNIFQSNLRKIIEKCVKKYVSDVKRRKFPSFKNVHK